MRSVGYFDSSQIQHMCLEESLLCFFIVPIILSHPNLAASLAL